MLESEFWDATLREVHNRIDGFRRLEDSRQRGEWERMRWLAMFVLMPHTKKGRKLGKPTDIMQFPWEKQKARSTAPAITEEQRRKAAEKTDKLARAIAKQRAAQKLQQ